jgi:hypothetical protein
VACGVWRRNGEGGCCDQQRDEKRRLGHFSSGTRANALRCLSGNRRLYHSHWQGSPFISEHLPQTQRRTPYCVQPGHQPTTSSTDLWFSILYHMTLTTHSSQTTLHLMYSITVYITRTCESHKEKKDAYEAWQIMWDRTCDGGVWRRSGEGGGCGQQRRNTPPGSCLFRHESNCALPLPSKKKPSMRTHI